MQALSQALPSYDKAPAATIRSKKDESRQMKAVHWYGKEDVRVLDTAVPQVTDPQDVVLKVTSTCICGSDLHLYEGAMPGMKKGDILGHEFMGVVEEIGPEVSGLQRGDRVVVSFDIACGACFYCKHQLFSGCDSTNPSKVQEAMYGHNTGGLFGYSHMTGGWDGGQAEYARVPLANTNCLKVPPGLPDDKVVLLSDILPTAWHACELGEVGHGDRVAIWGAGPVGLLAARCAFVRGATRVILIDQEEGRLEFAKKHIQGVQTINFTKKKPQQALREMFPDGTAPDVCIEAVGMHYTTSWLHWFETALKLETDPSEILNELIYCVRKGGRISVIGAYAGYCNHYNIGAFMEKGLTMKAGQCPVQRYWHKLLDMIQEGKLDPSFVITHRPPLAEAAEAYKIFNSKAEGCIKVVMKTGSEAAA